MKHYITNNGDTPLYIWLNDYMVAIAPGETWVPTPPAIELVAAGTDTSFDLGPFGDEEPTQPQISPGAPPYPHAGVWVPHNEGDELPSRRCKGCGNYRMRVVKIEGNWYAFCRLCGNREGL